MFLKRLVKKSRENLWSLKRLRRVEIPQRLKTQSSLRILNPKRSFLTRLRKNLLKKLFMSRSTRRSALMT